MGLTWGDNEKDISKDGGIMKIIVRKGEGYANPNDSAVCTVKYTGTADDTKFTTHGEDEEVTLNIDEDFSLPEGLVKALCSMNKGEKATFKVRSEYAYGEKGDEKLGIAPNTNLVYNIDLISFKNEKATWEMDVKEKLAAMVKKKGKGNTYFSMRKYGKAIDFYKKAVAIFPESDLKKAEADDKNDILKTQVSCHSNTALCHLKSLEFAECIKSCNKALRIDKRHVKSIYRRGQAFSYNGENAQALYDLKHALKLSPDDKSIAKLVAVVKRRVQKQKRKEKNLFKGMFDRMTLAQGKNAGYAEGEGDSSSSSSSSSSSDDSSDSSDEEEPEKESTEVKVETPVVPEEKKEAPVEVKEEKPVEVKEEKPVEVKEVPVVEEKPAEIKKEKPAEVKTAAVDKSDSASAAQPAGKKKQVSKKGKKKVVKKGKKVNKSNKSNKNNKGKGKGKKKKVVKKKGKKTAANVN